MRIARIVKSEGKWKIKFQSTKQYEPLMGWVKTEDPTQQLCMSFSTLDQALTYLNKNKIPFVSVCNNNPKTSKKSYYDNFTKPRAR